MNVSSVGGGWMPPVLGEWAERLKALGWEPVLTPGRPTWPRAVLWADHPHDANFYIQSAVSRPRRPGGPRRWPSKKRTYWYRPAGSGRERSPWYRVSAEEANYLTENVLDPDRIARTLRNKHPHGRLPLEETPCSCGKVPFDMASAQTVLDEAKDNRHRGTARRRERRMYQCPHDALVYHVTSRG